MNYRSIADVFVGIFIAMSSSTIALLQRIRHQPHATILPCVTLVGIGALSTRPAFVPMTILLSLLQIYFRTVFKTSADFKKYWGALVAVVIDLALATSVAHAPTSLGALDSKAESIFGLFIISLIASAVAVSSVVLENIVEQRCPSTRTNVLLSPAIWLTVWQVIAHISPMGWLTTWSPVLGTDAYAWMRPIFGPLGMMWAMAAWARTLGAFLLSIAEEGETPLITLEDTDEQVATVQPSRPPQNRSATVLLIALLALSIPSYFDRTYPVSLSSPDNASVKVACALPPPPRGDQTILDSYVKETQTLVPQAKVILWPETAVRFENANDRETAVQRLMQFNGATHDSFIAMTFEERMPSSKIRNGLVLVGGKEGAIFEYYKRNLVPGTCLQAANSVAF